MATKRAASYLRVSSEEQVEQFSLPAQQRGVDDFCRDHGYQIVARYRDEGKSARTDDLRNRPDFRRMLEDAEAGRFDVVIVHKLDRFARNLRVMLETLDRLERAGVGFASISEAMDFTTPMGRVVLSTMGSLAQFYSDNLSNETKKGKRERKAQGLYNGVLPFGARKGEDGIPVADPATHPGLMLAFDLAAGGKTDREIARALNDAGYRTTGNRGANPFTKDTVRPMLMNRFYLGELPDGQGGWLPAKHAALIDPALFAAAQTARERNTRRPLRTAGPGQPWALSGLGVCSCGASIIANGGHDGRRALRCAGRTQGSGCDAPSFYEDVLDEQLTTGILARFAVSEAETERLVAAWLRHQEGNDGATNKRGTIERRLARLREVYLDGDLDRAEYQKRRVALLAEREALPSGTATSDAVGRKLAAFLAYLPAAWAEATPSERNRLARQLFAEAIIDNRTVVAVKPRPELLPFFQAVNSCVGGSDGDRFVKCILPVGALLIAKPPPLRVAGRSKRATYRSPRQRKLSAEQAELIRAEAGHRTLRELAAAFGVSHETIRKTLRASPIAARQ